MICFILFRHVIVCVEYYVRNSLGITRVYWRGKWIITNYYNNISCRVRVKKLMCSQFKRLISDCVQLDKVFWENGACFRGISGEAETSYRRWAIYSLSCDKSMLFIKCNDWECIAEGFFELQWHLQRARIGARKGSETQHLQYHCPVLGWYSTCLSDWGECDVYLYVVLGNCQKLFVKKLNLINLNNIHIFFFFMVLAQQ